jgi:hypothetical protein
MESILEELIVGKGKDNRWYDKHSKLRAFLDSFKGMPARPRNALIKSVMALINQNNPGLFDEFVMNFQLDPNRRRWYDRDPYLWLMFNGLSCADKNLLKNVTSFLGDNLPKAS